MEAIIVELLCKQNCVNTQTRTPHWRLTDVVSHTLCALPVHKYTAKQSLTNHCITTQIKSFWSVCYLEVPLRLWKGPVSSNSISGGCQLLDNHILLTQETHQPLAVAGHPAVAVCGPFAPIKFDGVLGHLVLLQHDECPRRAEAQQPTYNLHPNPYFCLHPRVEINKERETWQTDDSRKDMVVTKINRKKEQDRGDYYDTYCLYSNSKALSQNSFNYWDLFLLMSTNSFKRLQSTTEFILLTSTACVYKAWYS